MSLGKENSSKNAKAKDKKTSKNTKLKRIGKANWERKKSEIKEASWRKATFFHSLKKSALVMELTRQILKDRKDVFLKGGPDAADEDSFEASHDDEWAGWANDDDDDDQNS